MANEVNTGLLVEFIGDQWILRDRYPSTNEINTGLAVDLVVDQWKLVGKNPCTVRVAKGGPAAHIVIEDVRPLVENDVDLQHILVSDHTGDLVLNENFKIVFERLVYARGSTGPAQVTVTPL